MSVVPLETPRTLRRVRVVLGVISNVASLAPGSEIDGIAVAWIVVKVGDGKDNAASGNGVRLSIAGAAVGICRASFTAVSGSLSDGSADRFPVLRVARPVFDGHGAISEHSSVIRFLSEV